MKKFKINLLSLVVISILFASLSSVNAFTNYISSSDSYCTGGITNCAYGGDNDPSTFAFVDVIYTQETLTYNYTLTNINASAGANVYITTTSDDTADMTLACYNYTSNSYYSLYSTDGDQYHDNESFTLPISCIDNSVASIKYIFEYSQGMNIYNNIIGFDTLPSEGPLNVTNFTVNNSYGSITFSPNAYFQPTQQAIDNGIFITPLSFYVDTTTYPELDVPAVLTFNNITYANPVILRNGLLCPANVCTNFSFIDGVLRFDVTGFSNYSIYNQGNFSLQYVNPTPGNQSIYRSNNITVNISIPSGTNTNWPTNLNTGLKVYYSFNENSGYNATDLSGNGNTGIDNGNIPRVTGKLGSALNISDASRFITMLNAIGLDSSSSYTVSFWTYFDDNSSTQVIYFLGTSSTGEQAMIYNAPPQNYRWNKNGVGGFQTGTGANVSVWDYHTIVVEGDTAKWLINGQEIYYCSSSCRALPGDPDFDTGSSIGSDGGNYLHGKIDEWSLWDRVLNQTEINQLYNNGLGVSLESTQISSITVGLYNSNNTLVYTNSTTNSSTYTVNINDLAEDKYVLYSTACDINNNCSSNAVYFISTNYPNSLITPTNGTTQSGSIITTPYIIMNLLVSYSNLTRFFLYDNTQTECYQESANVSTICGGLNTGVYYNIGSNSSAYDGDWNSWSWSSGGPSYKFFNVNYTKPVGAVSAKIQWADRDGSGNVSIPSACWNALPDKISIAYEDNSGEGLEGFCWNGSAYSNQIISHFGFYGANLVEEAIIWNISTPINTTSYSGLFLNDILSINWTLPFDGLYRFYATAFGSENSTELYNVTLDSTAPYFYLMSPANNTNISSFSANLSIGIYDLGLTNATIRLYNSTDLINSTYFNLIAFTNVTISEVYNLTYGDYYWQVEANDIANHTNLSEYRKFRIVDGTPPKITILEPLAESSLEFTTNTYYRQADNYTSIINDVSKYNMVSQQGFTIINSTSIYRPGSPSNYNTGALPISSLTLQPGRVLNITFSNYQTHDRYLLISFANSSTDPYGFTVGRTTYSGAENLYLTNAIPSDICSGGNCGLGGGLYFVTVNGLEYNNKYQILYNGTAVQVTRDGLVKIPWTTLTYPPATIDLVYLFSQAYPGGDQSIDNLLIQDYGYISVSNNLSNNFINHSDVNFTATIEDYGSGLKNATLHLITLPSTVEYPLSGSIQNVTSNYTLPDGTYNWYYTAFDNFDNLNTTPTYQIKVDANAPIVYFVYPTSDNGANVSSSFISVVVNYTEVFPENFTYNLYDSSHALINSSSISNLTSFTFYNLTNGVYYYNVSLSDQLGRVNSTETRSIILDTQSPFTVNTTLPLNNTYTNQSTQNFTISINDSLSGLKNATLNITNKNNGSSQTFFEQLNGEFTKILGIPVTLVDGIYSWYYKVYDYANNLLTTPVYDLTIDTASPSGQITYPLNTSYTSTINSISVKFRDTTQRYQEFADTQQYANNQDWVYVNYTKPTGADNATWQLGWSRINTTLGITNYSWEGHIENFTIPDVCFNNSNTLILRFRYYNYNFPWNYIIDFQCKDSPTTYLSLYSDDWGYDHDCNGAQETNNLVVNTVDGYWNVTKRSTYPTDAYKPVVSTVYRAQPHHWSTPSLGSYCAGYPHPTEGFGFYEEAIIWAGDFTPENISVEFSKDGSNYTNEGSTTLSSYSFLANSSEGTNRCFVRTTDSASNQNVSNVTFFVDSIAPTLQLDSGTDSTNSYVNRTSVNYNVTVNDTNTMIVNLDLYSNGSIVANKNYTGSGQYSFNGSFTGLTNRAYDINVSVFDILKNNASDSRLNITVDTVNPVAYYVNQTLPTNGIYRQDAIWVNVSAYDINLDSINITLLGPSYSNSQVLIATNQNESFYYNWTGLIEGTYNYTGVAKDRAGNTYTLSTVIIDLDNSAPVMNYQLPTPSDGGTVGLNYVPVNVTAVDGHLANITIKLMYPNNSVYSTVTSGSSPFYYEFAVADGDWKFSATAADTLNNIQTLPVRSVYKEFNGVNVTICRTLFASGNYILQNDITDNTLGSGDACMKITADNVNLDCNGYSISTSSNADAVWSAKAGFTVSNCTFDVGRYGVRTSLGASGSVINTIVQNSDTGIYAVDSSVNAQSFTSDNNVYGIYAYRAGITASTLTISDTEVGFRLRDTNNANVNGVIYSGYSGTDDLVYMTGSNGNNFNNIKALSATDNQNNGLIRLDSSSNNLFSNGNFTTSENTLIDLVDDSINNTFLDTYYGTGLEDIDGTSQLIRSWSYTAIIKDKVGSPIGGGTVRIRDSNNTNYTFNTNDAGIAQGIIPQYDITNGTTTIRNPQDGSAIFRDLTTPDQSANINQPTNQTFILGQEVTSTLLTRTVARIIMVILFLIGLASSIGYFVFKMRYGDSVADTWKYFIMMLIWTTIFIVLFIVLSGFVMDIFYPAVTSG